MAPAEVPEITEKGVGDLGGNIRAMALRTPTW
jgi:hypothetical protein